MAFCGKASKIVVIERATKAAADDLLIVITKLDNFSYDRVTT